MSSVFALILNESPLAMTVFGRVPKATGSVPRYKDQCVTVPTSAVAVPKSMSAVISMSPLDAVLMFAAVTVAPVPKVPPPADTRPPVGLAFDGAEVWSRAGQVRPANSVG